MRVWQDIVVSRAPGAAFVTMGMVWAAFAAQVPVIKAQIGAGDAAFGSIFLIASLGAIASMWIAPAFERMLGARSVQVSSVAMAVCFVLAGASGGVVGFTVAFLLVSAMSGVADILMNARISEIEQSTERPLMNLNHAIFSFAYAGTAVMTGLAREAGWGPVAVFGAVAAGVAVLALGMYAPPRRADDPAGRPNARPPSRGIVWICGLVVLAAFFTEQATEGWSALHIERGLGGGAAQGAMGPAVLGLTMGFGRLFGHALATRMRDTAMMGWACAISAVGAVVAALAPGIATAYAGFAIMGLGVSVVVPLAMAIVGRAVPEAARVRAIGQASVIGYGAFLFGPALMGGVAEMYSLAVSFLMVGAVLLAVVTVLVPMIVRRLASVDAAV